MSAKINKNEKEYDLGFMPEHYPADRVYLDGDITKTVQGFVLKAVEIPYNDFSFDTNGKFFYKQNLTLPFNTLVGFIVLATNSSTIYGTRFLSNNSEVRIFGDTTLDASYKFTCYAVGL